MLLAQAPGSLRSSTTSHRILMIERHDVVDFAFLRRLLASRVAAMPVQGSDHPDKLEAGLVRQCTRGGRFHPP